MWWTLLGRSEIPRGRDSCPACGGALIYEGTIEGSDVDYALSRCSWCGGKYYKKVVHWF